MEKIVIAACCLHNFLRQECPDYASVGSMDTEDSETHRIRNGDWRNDTQPQGWRGIVAQSSNMYAQSAKAIRDEFCLFFNSPEGQVSWQWNMV